MTNVKFMMTKPVLKNKFFYKFISHIIDIIFVTKRRSTTLYTVRNKNCTIPLLEKKSC